MSAFTANEADIIRARENLLCGMGLDAKRPTAWTVYGYTEHPTFDQLYLAYERNGAGNGAVHRLLDRCWQDWPRIKAPDKDEETPFEQEIENRMKKCRAWAKLRDFDRRNMVGRYAGLIYRVRDGKALREPLERAAELVDLVPVFEGQLKVTQWHADPAREDYGLPAMFQFRSRNPNKAMDTQGRPEEWVDVHPSRVQILAEGSVGDMFDGVPLLLAGFNHLVDLEKVSGGSGESYLKNSARTVVYKFEQGSSPMQLAQTPGQAALTDPKAAIEAKTRDLNSNQDASIVLAGGDAHTLQTAVADPRPSFEVSANLFAASVRMPFTVLFGQQTGRLASDEDQKEMNARAASRRETELTPMLEEFVSRMQAAGIFPAGPFEVEWEDLGAPTDEQKLKNGLTMAQIAQTAFNAGLTEPTYDANEIRKATGYEERKSDGMPKPEDMAAVAALEQGAGLEA